MEGNGNVQRGQIRGYLFEVALMSLLKKNGFSTVQERTQGRIKGGEYDVEIRGRGTWHQIDLLLNYNTLIPFFYPIRMIGEAKFFTKTINEIRVGKEVSKERIREFIGVIKDIQENYFATDDDLSNHPARVSELGVFFAANGFQEEAEKLAYAHNIKTISYKNNPLIDQIKNGIMELEKVINFSSCFSEGKRNDFLNIVQVSLEEDRNVTLRDLFDDSYELEVDFFSLLYSLKDSIRRIKGNFIGTTSGGVFLHFIGENELPDRLFRGEDEARCRVHFDYNNRFRIEFTDDNDNGKYYFTPPKSLKDVMFFDKNERLAEKEQIFGKVQFFKEIDGKKRNLTIKIDNEWLEQLRNRQCRAE